MTDVTPAKMDGTAGTSGTALILRDNSGPVVDDANGTSGTGKAATQPVVPLVPLQPQRTGPEKPHDFNVVPLVPLVPSENDGAAPDLVAAFEAIFAAAENRVAAQDGAGRGRDGATPLAADLDAFEERATIAEHDGGASRDEAERMAAGALGFPEPAALFAAAADVWRRKLEALAATLSPDRAADARGRECIAAALRFIADGWAEKTAALGWPEIELFGADPCAPWERLDRLGAAYLPFTPSAVTASCITYPGTGTTPMRKWRASQADGARLSW